MFLYKIVVTLHLLVESRIGGKAEGRPHHNMSDIRQERIWPVIYPNLIVSLERTSAREREDGEGRTGIGIWNGRVNNRGIRPV